MNELPWEANWAGVILMTYPYGFYNETIVGHGSASGRRRRLFAPRSRSYGGSSPLEYDRPAQ